jgi:hypothetical protein
MYPIICRFLILVEMGPRKNRSDKQEPRGIAKVLIEAKQAQEGVRVGVDMFKQQAEIASRDRQQASQRATPPTGTPKK